MKYRVDRRHEHTMQHDEAHQCLAMEDIEKKLAAPEHLQAKQSKDMENLCREIKLLEDIAKEMQQQQAASVYENIASNSRDTASEQVAALDLDQKQQLENRQKSIRAIEVELKESFKVLVEQQVDEQRRATDTHSNNQPELAQHHERQKNAIDALIESTRSAIQNIETAHDTLLDQGRKLLGDTLTGLKQIEDPQAEANRQANEREVIDRRISMLELYVEKQTLEIINSLKPEQLQVAREVSRLSEELINDTGLERAVREGQRYLEAGLGKAVAAVQGQLFEEMFAFQQDNELRIKQNNELLFIAGDRIRDELGRKLTDGLLVRHNEKADLYEIIKAFESKASVQAAKKLTSEIEAMTDIFKLETQLYAQDLAIQDLLNRGLTREEMERDKNRPFDDLTKDPQYSADLVNALTSESLLKQVRDDNERQLLSREVQRTNGQLERTQERLDMAKRIFIDNQLVELTDTKRRTPVEAVVPKGVKNDTNAFELHVTEEQLRAAARALMAWLQEERDKEIQD
jgi:hypothetical protein